MASIFQRLRSEDIQTSPFPHIACESLLEKSFYESLAEAVPSFKKIANRKFTDDQKHYYSGKMLLTDPIVSEQMKEFVRENTSPQAFYDFFNLFERNIEQEFPGLSKRLLNVRPSKIGLRGEGNPDIHLDAQIVYFAPISGKEPTAERRVHLKTSEKLFGSFLCFRKTEDVSTGADFVLHGVKGDATPGQRNQISEHLCVPVSTFRRKENSFIGFLNTSRAFTQMTPRSTSVFPAIYANIVVGLAPRLWNPSLFSRITRGWQRW